jgi:RNA-directed DNA polymerase
VPDPPPHRYLARAEELGRDLKVARRALAYAESLRARGTTPIFTLGHLAQLTGARSRYLREVVSRSRDPYVSIERPKRDGTTRPISSPEPVMMDVQRWLLHNALDACEIHESSWAYRPGRSAVQCAAKHIGARWIVKLDVHDFFGSVDEVSVFDIFEAIGYPRLLSFELARLCTRPKVLGVPYRRGDTPYRKLPSGSLPQGAPTSGALANAAMRRVDTRLARLAERRGLIYTRYSDDLVFSTAGAFNRSKAAGLIEEVGAVLRADRFTPHLRKTRVVPPGARQVVLGLLVLEDRVALPSGFRRQMEVHVRGVRQFGVQGHAKHRRYDSVFSMIAHVDGCISFARCVDRTFADRIDAEWRGALLAAGLPDV